MLGQAVGDAVMPAGDAVLVTKVDPPQVWSGCVRPGSRRYRASFNVRPSVCMERLC